MVFLTSSIVYDIVALVTVLIAGAVTYLKWKQTYWTKKGVPGLNPSLPFGDCREMFRGKTNFGQQFNTFYKEFRNRGEQFGGIFIGVKPFLVPVEPELVKSIMQTDFPHFVNHGNFINEDADPLTGHLFNLEDAKWKNMRAKLTPTFTSGKMKMMFQTLVDCTVGLGEIMEDAERKKDDVDIKDVLGRFTTDIIGSAAFGLDCNSLKDPNSEFRVYGNKVFQFDLRRKIKGFILNIVPESILKAINFKTTNPDVEKFFMRIVKDTVEYREKNNVYRKDFMHLLLQLKNRGKVTDDEHVTGGGKSEGAITLNELTAQAFVFFLAGFETSSTTMTFALLELAQQPKLQQKLRDEINTVLENHNGEVTYDAIMEMTYMDNVINETLRKHPPIPAHLRKCTKDYIIPGTDICIEKGAGVAIPAFGLQHDPEYYPDPERFDPDRFTKENKQTRPSFTWLPFGEGPRACIGLRFGMMQTKVGLTALLRNYQIKLSPKTQTPIEYDKKSPITQVAGGVWLNAEKI